MDPVKANGPAEPGFAKYIQMGPMGPKGPNGSIRAQWTLMSMGQGSQMWPSERKSKETRGVIQETGVLSTPIQR